MTPPSHVDVEAARAARRTRIRRIVRRTVYAKLGILLTLAVVLSAVYLRLAAGPVSLRSYSSGVAQALAGQIGPGWTVSFSDTALELYGAKPAVRVSGLEIRNPEGGPAVRAPYAVVSLDPASLLIGTLSPREIDLRDLEITALLRPDGSLAFVPSSEFAGREPAISAPPVVPATPPAPAAPAAAGPSTLAVAVSSLFDSVLKPAGIVGALDRASLTNARLSLVGPEGRERVTFRQLNATFSTAAGGERRVEASLVGPNGPWRIGGRIQESQSGSRDAELSAADVPVTDILLLTGLSGLPTGSNLKLSGQLSASADGASLTRLDGTFASSAGIVNRPGQAPVQIDALSGRASWNEPGRRLDLSDLEVKSGDTKAHLDGKLSAEDDGSWRLKLSGRDLTFAGATARDPAFGVAELAADLQFGDRGISVDNLALKGDRVNLKVSGSSTAGPNGPGVQAKIEAADTSVRRLLSLWPNEINPDLRGYLLANMTGGTVTALRIKTDLDNTDLIATATGKPISDPSLSLTFSLADAQLNVIDGLPPLRGLVADGKASGTKTTLYGRGGRIELPDGRRLNFTEALYDQANLDKPNSVARISFRLDGGADAVASFLRTPMLRDATGFDTDPANVKGRADLRVSLPLDPHKIPKPADMPINVTGTLSDLSLDHALGRERLEGANLAVTYDSGALAIKGDGKVGGLPAAIDLHQAKGAPGEAIVQMTLDEAARQKRNLPAGPQLAGPVPVKVAAPFGPGAKGPVRIEADLGRASVEGLLPGWSKPAGKSGRVSFSVGDNAEVRDINLESGPVQLRGNAVMGQDGGVDHADLSVIKVSPGDDLRAQLDRSGNTYKVNLKGNVGDARPLMKWLTAAPGGGGQKGRESPDVDVEVGVNILTGFNDEALTGVVASASTRNHELRSLSLKGQFRSAPVTAQLSRADGGQPMLTLQSADAGATLRFLDLYKRMVGGALNVQATMADAAQSGRLAIDNFILKNEPALKRIASQGPTMAGDSDTRGSGEFARLDGDQVQFTKLTGEFRRSASRVEYKDVVVWGAQVGFNLSALVDYGRDRTEVVGTFVPAYGINNAFSQLPVIGLILGGDRNEGLFAVNFRVAGPVNSPSLTVNPISAVAPGILRKIFGLIMQDGEMSGASQTGTLPAPDMSAAGRARSKNVR